MPEINQNVTDGNHALGLVLDSLLADLTNLHTAFNVAISKLNADGSVSDTDYAEATSLTTTS
jgi:hypothetical protein